MGRKLVLSGVTLTDPTAPLLPDVDPILPASGALVYIDPTHPARSWDAGVPATGSAVPNVAEAAARSATGLSAEQVSPTVTHLGARKLVERSGKGGLHVAFSQDETGSATTDHLLITLPAAFRAWLQANKSHSFYASIWGRVTRERSNTAIAGGHLVSILSSGNTAASLFLRRIGDTGPAAYPSTARIGTDADGHNLAAPVPFFIDGAWSDFSASALDRGEIAYLRREPGAASVILYGYYLEDLTLSGRTYAQVNALVKARRDGVTGTGGRYAGDTYTPPTSAPA